MSITDRKRKGTPTEQLIREFVESGEDGIEVFTTRIQTLRKTIEKMYPGEVWPKEVVAIEARGRRFLIHRRAIT